MENKLELTTKILKENYPDVKCGLNFNSAYELLIATVLSAQCTDVRVNKVTPELFLCANTPEKMVSLGYDKLYSLIQTCGLADTKTKNILSLSQSLIDNFNCNVPDNMKDLMSLPGVGRKTANVVLANAFGVPTIAVDTHVFRVANRIGYAHEKNVLKTEYALMDNIAKEDWTLMHHILIWHGRLICHSQKPECSSCCIKELCEYNLNNVK